MERFPGNSVANSSGAASIEFQPRGGRPVRVHQVSEKMGAAPGGATCELQLNGRYVTTLVAQGDVADGPPPLDMDPGDVLTVVWAGATAGNLCEATFFYEYLT